MKYKRNIQRLLSLLLVTGLMLTGCGKLEDTTGKDEVQSTVDAQGQNTSEGEEKTDDGIMESNTEEVKEADKKLLPDTEYIVRYPYYYMCYELDDVKKTEYKEALQSEGYVLKSTQTISEVTYEYYTGPEKYIQVVDGDEAMVISVADIYNNMEIESSDYPLDTVSTMIQASYKQNIESGMLTSSDAEPDIYIKCWIPELYEKAQIQAYTTLTKERRESGVYLIADDMAYRTIDALDTICIADIDGNGTSELLSLYGFGSGIYRINLNVYQYSNPIYFSGPKKIVHCCYSNCFVPKQGYGQLGFVKVSDSEVHLVEVEENGADYGKLIVDSFSNWVKLENMEKFPYYQWSECFQKDEIDVNSDSNNANAELLNLKQVPALTVKISDQLITNQSAKINWDGEAEDSISFCDLMTDEIPMFECPDGFYEYDDEFCFTFDGVKPSSIIIEDYLLTDSGAVQYGETGIIERDVRYGEDGNYYLGLMTHMALYLSSNTYSYTTPSYRGFKLTCEFDEDHVCEYAFVVSMAPVWGE